LELFYAIANRGNLNFIQRARRLFPITSNERHRSAIHEKRANRPNLVRLQFQFLSNLGNVNWVFGHVKKSASNMEREFEKFKRLKGSRFGLYPTIHCVLSKAKSCRNAW
jgi:hypothetical protein